MEDKELDEELKILAGVKSRIKGNPLCRRANCNGAGVLGITVVMIKGQKKAQLLTCECAAFGETEYKRLYDEISALNTATKAFLIHMQKIICEDIDNLRAETRGCYLANNQDMVDLHHHRSFAGYIAWKIGEARNAARQWWYKARKRAGK